MALSASVALLIAAVVPNAIPTATTSLFYLDESAGSCVGKVRALPTRTEKRLFSAKECPSHVVFDGPRVVTSEGDFIRERAIAGRKVTELSKEKLALGDLWMEESGKLRGTTLLFDVTMAKDVKAMKFEGKEYPVELDNDEAFPSWGTPAMALLVELEADGAWARLEAKPTKTEACDTPGTRVLDTPRTKKKRVVVLGDLRREMICASDGPLRCNSEAALVTKLVLTGREGPAGVLEIDDKTALAFAVRVVDSAHALTPLYLCKDGCKTSTLLERTPDGGHERALSLAHKGGFILIADEYSGADARVVDLAGKTVFTAPKGSSAAAFLPE